MDTINTSQLKNLVMDRIWEIDDEEFLKAIKKILDVTLSAENVYKLSVEQKESIRIAKEQIKNGESISNEDLEREEDQWLNE